MNPFDGIEDEVPPKASGAKSKNMALFDDIEDEVTPKPPVQGGWNASMEPAKPPKFQTADEPSANALNWMATGTADRSNPADIGKPHYYDDLPHLERNQDPKDRTISVLANAGGLGFLPYIRAGVEAQNRGESFWGGSPRYERERKALQQYYLDAHERAQDEIRVLGGIGLPGGPMVQAGKYLTSASRPIATGAALGAGQAGVAGYLAPIEPATGDVAARLTSAAESIPYGAAFGAGAGAAGKVAQSLRPQLSTPEQLEAFHQRIAETAPEYQPNPFNENVRAADAIHNRGRLIEDQTGRPPAEEARSAVPPEKPAPSGNLFDDIPDVAPVKAAPEAKLEVSPERPAPAGDIFSDIPDAVPAKSALEAQGLPQAAVTELATNVAGERLLQPQEPPVAPQGQMYAIAGERGAISHLPSSKSLNTPEAPDEGGGSDHPYAGGDGLRGGPHSLADYADTDSGKGYDYVRRTRRDHPESDYGHMMFLKGGVDEALEHLGPYGDRVWLSKEGIRSINSDDIALDIYELLKDHDMLNRTFSGDIPSFEESEVSINPSDIVNSAGIWDDKDITEKVYNEILEPRGIDTVFTNDGMVTFNPDNVKYYGYVHKGEFYKSHNTSDTTAYAISAHRQFRGTFPEGQEAESYAMKLTDAEPFIFAAVERANRLDKVAADLESGNVTDKTRMTLGFATQDVNVLANKLGLGTKNQTAPVEIALQDAKTARDALQTAYDARDPEAFKAAAGELKNALAQAAQARIEVVRRRSEPKAFDYYVENHLPEGVKAALASDPAYAITAYHGGPHDFDRFDSSKIGTGEGAQAYGHGLYFAEKEGVAQSYAKILGADKGLLLNGKPENEFPPSVSLAAKELFLSKGDRKSAIATLNEELSELKARGDRSSTHRENVKKAIKILGGKSILPTVSRDQGRLYTVSLDVEPYELLDWDKPLSEQPEKVRKALSGLLPDARTLAVSELRPGLFMIVDELGRPLSILADAFDSRAAAERAIKSMTNDGMTGMEIIQRIGGSKGIGGTKGASDALHKAGITGIRYLDQNSRAKGEGSYNYVIFPGAEDRIKITAKDGKPVSGEERADVIDQSQQDSALRQQQSNPAAEKFYQTAAKRAVEQGMPFDVHRDTVSRVTEAAAPHLHQVPDGYHLGVLTKIEPGDSLQMGGKETPFVIAHYRTPDGIDGSLLVPRDNLFGSRAIVDSGNGVILLTRLNAGGDLVGPIGGEVNHEITHALDRSGAFGGRRGALLAHANGPILDVMSTPYNEFLRYIGEPTWKSRTDLPLRELYEERYRGRQDFRRAMEGEAIAHMAELYYHDRNMLSPQELQAKYGPVLNDLEGLYNGMYTGKVQEKSGARLKQAAAYAIGPGKESKAAFAENEAFPDDWIYPEPGK